MTKPGDIVMIFANPVELTTPLGQARLITKLEEREKTDLWTIEFLDDEEHYYNYEIKKV